MSNITEILAQLSREANCEPGYEVTLEDFRDEWWSSVHPDYQFPDGELAWGPEDVDKFIAAVEADDVAAIVELRRQFGLSPFC